MFINIRNLVEPVSRGQLASNLDPDYPPLCWACDEAREQDGVVIWCHNGRGMEAPVAAVLGKLDAFNLFDPLWADLEYTIYYRMLNAGIRLPASTGTDWFVCSSNRVYVGTESEFSYQAWLDGMKAGSTFITNGPSLMLEVDGRPVGSVLTPSRPRKLGCHVRWESHYPVTLAELDRQRRGGGAYGYTRAGKTRRLGCRRLGRARLLGGGAIMGRRAQQLRPRRIRAHKPCLRRDWPHSSGKVSIRALADPVSGPVARLDSNYAGKVCHGRPARRRERALPRSQGKVRRARKTSRRVAKPRAPLERGYALAQRRDGGVGGRLLDFCIRRAVRVEE